MIIYCFLSGLLFAQPEEVKKLIAGMHERYSECKSFSAKLKMYLLDGNGGTVTEATGKVYISDDLYFSRFDQKLLWINTREMLNVDLNHQIFYYKKHTEKVKTLRQTAGVDIQSAMDSLKENMHRYKFNLKKDNAGDYELEVSFPPGNPENITRQVLVLDKGYRLKTIHYHYKKNDAMGEIRGVRIDYTGYMFNKHPQWEELNRSYFVKKSGKQTVPSERYKEFEFINAESYQDGKY